MLIYGLEEARMSLHCAQPHLKKELIKSYLIFPLNLQSLPIILQRKGKAMGRDQGYYSQIRLSFHKQGLRKIVDLQDFAFQCSSRLLFL